MRPDTCAPRYAYNTGHSKNGKTTVNHVQMAHKGIQFRITGDFLTTPLLLVIAE